MEPEIVQLRLVQWFPLVCTLKPKGTVSGAYVMLAEDFLQMLVL